MSTHPDGPRRRRSARPGSPHRRPPRLRRLRVHRGSPAASGIQPRRHGRRRRSPGARARLTASRRLCHPGSGPRGAATELLPPRSARTDSKGASRTGGVLFWWHARAFPLTSPARFRNRPSGKRNERETHTPQRGRLRRRRPVAGRRRPHQMRLAEHEMPGLMAIRREYAAAQPLKGARIAGLAAHDRADRRAHRDPGRARRRGALGVLQHLLHPGRGRRRGRRRPGGHPRRARPARRCSPGRARRSKSTGGAPTSSSPSPAAGRRT